MAKEYTRTTWENTPSTATPIDENNLNNMESGIDNNDTRTQNQEAENKAIFNGVTSKAVSGTYTSFNAQTIYFEMQPATQNTPQIWLQFDNGNDKIILQNGSDVVEIRSANGFQTFTGDIGDLRDIRKVAFRWTGSVYNIFVNGVKLAASPGTGGHATLLNSTSLALGLRNNNQTLFYDGLYKDVRIASFALTEQEVLDLTSGAEDADVLLDPNNTEIVYTRFDASTNFGNEGTEGISADATATDVKKGDFTVFADYIEDTRSAFSTTLSASISSVADGTTIPFDTITFDEGQNFDTANYRYVAPISGVYTFHVKLGLTGATDQQRIGFNFNKNGTNVGNFTGQASGSSTVYYEGTKVLFLTAGDQIEVISNTFGTTQNIAAGAIITHFEGYKIV